MTQLLQGYIFDTSVQRYRYLRTGRFVARDRIIDLLERSIDSRERRVLRGTQRFLDGAISPATWITRTKTMLRRQHLQMAALAKGGWDRLTPHDYGRVGGTLRAEYDRIANMAGQIARGEVSEAQAANRMHMYLGNARKEFFLTERENLRPADFGNMWIEKRRLEPTAQHCEDCLRYNEMGWQSLGVLPVPSEDSQCDGNCRCTMERRQIPTYEASQWIGNKTRKEA